MAADADLEELRRRAAEPATAEEALDLNHQIVALAPNDGVALNRLGRAYQDLGYVRQAIETFERAIAVDPANTIAPRRLRDLRIGPPRTASASGGATRTVELRSPEEALAVLDGWWRSDCVGLLADLVLFARRLDRERTIVRDVGPAEYFYVAGGAHAAAGPWDGLMDCYADHRRVEQHVIDRVLEEGGRYRPAPGEGYAPDSLRLEIPFGLIGELRPALVPAMRDHIKAVIVVGPPQHMHLRNDPLLEAILAEAAG